MSRFRDAQGITRWYTDCYYLFGSWFPLMLDAAAKCGVTGVQVRACVRSGAAWSLAAEGCARRGRVSAWAG